MNRRCFQLVRLLLACGCLFIPPLAVTLPCLAQTPTADSPQDATKQALSQMLQDYISHFNSRDFESLANLLSEKVTYNDESTQVSGATALVDGMRKLTTDEPSVKLSIEIQGIDLEGDDAAIATGIASLTEDTSSAERSRFKVTFSKSADKWNILSITESATTPSAADAIESLQWLIGSWQDADDPTLQTTVRRVPGNQFLQRTVERRTDNGMIQIATEMIGYDPTLHQVRSWLFFADGSFGTGTWRGESDLRKIQLQQTLVDGSKATGTYVLRPTSPDSMTFQLISRVINGELQPMGQPTSLTRITAATSSTIQDSKVNP